MVECGRMSGFRQGSLASVITHWLRLIAVVCVFVCLCVEATSSMTSFSRPSHSRKWRKNDRKYSPVIISHQMYSYRQWIVDDAGKPSHRGHVERSYSPGSPQLSRGSGPVRTFKMEADQQLPCSAGWNDCLVKVDASDKPHEALDAGGSRLYNLFVFWSYNSQVHHCHQELWRDVCSAQRHWLLPLFVVWKVQKMFVTVEGTLDRNNSFKQWCGLKVKKCYIKHIVG